MQDCATLLKNLTIIQKSNKDLFALLEGLVVLKYKTGTKYLVASKLKQKHKFAPLPNLISVYEKGEIQESNVRIVTRFFNCIDVS